MPPTTRDSRRTAWLGHQRAAAALAAFQAFAPREPFVVVKGVALCARYGWDPADVPISDVDLRVTTRSWWRLRQRLLGAEGACLLQDSPLYANLVLELAGHLVDIEACVGPPFLNRLRVEGLLARAELASVPGAEPFLVPSTTDHALLLAVNLFKDGLRAATPNARRNAVRLVEEPLFDIPTFVLRARRARMHTLAATVATDLAADSPTWAAVATALGGSEHPLYSSLHARSHRTPHAWPARIVRRLGSDSLRDQAVSLGLGLGYFATSLGRGQL